MKEFKPFLNIYLTTTILLFWPLIVFAQSVESDIVEIETDVLGGQIKPSDIISKPTIKPRADYIQGQPNLKKISTVPSLKASDKQLIQNAEQTNLVTQLPSTTDDQPLTSNPQSLVSSPQFTAPSEYITDSQVVQMSSNLRKLIDENAQLKENLSQLDQQLRTARGQQKLDTNRLNEVALERDALKKQNENIVTLGSRSDERLQVLQKELTEKEQNYNMQIVRLQTELAQKLRSTPAVQLAPLTADSVFPTDSDKKRQGSVSVDLVSSSTQQQALDAQARSEKILLALSTYTDQKQVLSRDEARVHYNMGNNFYNQGDYLKAGEEYKKSVTLAPDDASAHYNLAFVSAEYLSDPRTALEHYKKYLFYNPRAEDATLVQQKIIEAEISVKGDIEYNTHIDDEVRKKKNELYKIRTLSPEPQKAAKQNIVQKDDIE